MSIKCAHLARRTTATRFVLCDAAYLCAVHNNVNRFLRHMCLTRYALWRWKHSGFAPQRRAQRRRTTGNKCRTGHGAKKAGLVYAFL